MIINNEIRKQTCTINEISNDLMKTLFPFLKRHFSLTNTRSFKNNILDMKSRFLLDILTSFKIIKNPEDFTDDLNLYPEMINYLNVIKIIFPFNEYFNFINYLDYIKNDTIFGNDIVFNEKICLTKFFQNIGISNKFVNFIHNAKISRKGNLAVGPGELLLAIFFKNGFLCKNKGDVGIKQDDGSFQTIEVKSGSNAKIGDSISNKPNTSKGIYDFLTNSGIEKSNLPDKITFKKLEPFYKNEIILHNPKSKFNRLEFLTSFINTMTVGVYGDKSFTINSDYLNYNDVNNTGRIFKSKDAFEHFKRDYIKYAFNVYSNYGKCFNNFAYIDKDEKTDELNAIVLSLDSYDFIDKAMELIRFKFPTFGGDSKTSKDHVLGTDSLY